MEFNSKKHFKKLISNKLQISINSAFYSIKYMFNYINGVIICFFN